MTREEALNEGIKVLNREEAIEVVTEQLSESLSEDPSAILEFVANGWGGIDNMTDEELEDFFEFMEDVYILEWKLEA
jgi:hypothetical protein